MTHARRRKVKPGSYLEAVPAESLIPKAGDLAELHARLLAMGYTLTKTVRPYLTRDLCVSVCVVWRKRSEGLCSTYRHSEKIPLSEVRSAR